MSDPIGSRSQWSADGGEFQPRAREGGASTPGLAVDQRVMALLAADWRAGAASVVRVVDSAGGAAVKYVEWMHSL